MTLHNISRSVPRPVPESARMSPQPGGRWSTVLRSVAQGSQGDLVQEFNMEANVACPSPVRRPPEPLSERSYDPLPTRFLPQPNTSSDAWSFKTTSYNAHKAMFAPHATLRWCTNQAGAPLRTHYSRLSKPWVYRENSQNSVRNRPYDLDLHVLKFTDGSKKSRLYLLA